MLKTITRPGTASPRRGAARAPAGRNLQRGVSLLEALVSIFIFSVGILGLIGMQVAAMHHASEANYRAEATYLANAAIGTMWGDIADLPDYAAGPGEVNAKNADWQAALAARLPGGAGEVKVAGDQVTVIVRWKSPGGEPHNHTVTTRIKNSS